MNSSNVVVPSDVDLDVVNRADIGVMTNIRACLQEPHPDREPGAPNDCELSLRNLASFRNDKRLNSTLQAEFKLRIIMQ